MFVQRSLLAELKKYATSPEILAVIGPRQSGKTTLVKKFVNDKEGVSEVTFENEKMKKLFEEDIDIFIQKHVKRYNILFIDEVQYVSNAGKNLKYIYDTQDIKIILTGSSAIDIAINSLSYLVGRILTFNLYPLSFHEIAQHKHNINTYDFGAATVNILNEDLNTFIRYGGYPEVYIRETEEQKKKVLEGLFQTLLKRDIRRYFDIKDSSFINLLEYISLHNGKLLNIADVSRNTGISRHNIKEYITVLEQAYVLKTIKPFYKNKKKEVVKHPEVFFIDNGLKNAVMETYSKQQLYDGYNYESHVFSELIKYGHKPQFWRSKNKAEVDIVLTQDKKPVPIEIKRTLANNSIGKSMHSFIKKYNPDYAFMLSKTYEDTKTVRKTKVHFVPIVKTKKISRILRT